MQKGKGLMRPTTPHFMAYSGYLYPHKHCIHKAHLANYFRCQVTVYNYMNNCRERSFVHAHCTKHQLQLQKYFLRELFLLPGYSYNYMNYSPACVIISWTMVCFADMGVCGLSKMVFTLKLQPAIGIPAHIFEHWQWTSAF